MPTPTSLVLDLTHRAAAAVVANLPPAPSPSAIPSVSPTAAAVANTSATSPAPSPSPSAPIRVVVESTGGSGDGFTGWLDRFSTSPAMAGLLGLVAAGIAFYGIHRTIQSTRVTAARDHEWERLQWAVELANKDGDERSNEIGTLAIRGLAAAEQKSPELEQLIDDVANYYADALTSGTLEAKPVSEGLVQRIKERLGW